MAKKTKKVVKKVEKNTKDDPTLTLVLGMLLVSINDFTEGGIIEKIIVICGFALMILGIIPKDNIKKKKTGMIIALSLLGVVTIALAVMLIINSINK